MFLWWISWQNSSIRPESTSNIALAIICGESWKTVFTWCSILAVNANKEGLSLWWDLVLEAIGVEYIGIEFFCFFDRILVIISEFRKEFILCTSTLGSESCFYILLKVQDICLLYAILFHVNSIVCEISIVNEIWYWMLPLELNIR